MKLLKRIKKNIPFYGIKSRLSHVFKNKLNDSKNDDFNWVTYVDHYKEEIAEREKTQTLKLSGDEFTFDGNKLLINEDYSPLHPNCRLLYETILLLNPKSVFEVGCGGGDHLHNINILTPGVELRGIDRSENQLELLKDRSPHLKEFVSQLDITLPFSSLIKSAELAYTQAVIMHIQTGNGHLVALSNLFRISSKYVLLMENWKRHNFYEDIKMLYEKGMLPWDQIHFYYRRSPEYQNKPHLMVVSSEPLKFDPLESYSQLLPENI